MTPRAIALAFAALLCLPASAGAQDVPAAQSPADAYRACIVGNAVVALLQEGYEGGDAGIRGLALCDYMVPDVPEAQAVEDDFIAFWDNQLVDLLAPETP